MTDTDESQYPYELTIILKKGNVRGGGLSNASHVITSIDGIEIHKSEDSPSPPHWNQTIEKKLLEIQRVDPIMLGFSVYKKRWTAAGYKLVGSTQFPLTELLPILNKEPLEKEIHLNTNRLNLTLSGSLTVSLQLKEVKQIIAKSNEEEVKEEPFQWDTFFAKWKSILTTSKRPVNAIVLNWIHDIGSLFKYLGRYDNPFFGSVVKFSMVVLILIYLLMMFFERRDIARSVENIDQSITSIIHVTEGFLGKSAVCT